MALKTYMAKVEDLAGRNETLSEERNRWEQESDALKLLNNEIQEKLKAHEDELNSLRGMSF